jgi:two-component system NtrC family sensor kinase
MRYGMRLAESFANSVPRQCWILGCGWRRGANREGGMKKRPKYFQYARKMIFLGIVFVPLIPYLMALVIAYILFINSVSGSSHNTMRRIVHYQAQFIENYLDERRSDLAFILQTVPVEQLSQPETIKKLLAEMQKESSAFVDLGLIDASGKHLAYSGPHQLLDKNYAESEWFLATREHGEYVSDVFLGFRDVPHFVVAKSSGGPTPIILRATIDSDAFSKMVESVRVGETGEAFLLNGKGQYQTRHPGKWDLLDTIADPESYLGPVYGVQTFLVKSGDGTRYLSAIASINNGRWKLVAQQETGDAFHDIYASALYILLVSALGGVTTVSLALYASNRIGKTLLDIDGEKDHLRDRLYRSVRLAELGEMTASFAHEINNPLQIMKSELTLLGLILEDAEKIAAPFEGELKKDVQENLDQVLLQINRCSEITSSILRFGRKEPAVATSIDLNDLVRDIGTMVAKKAETRGIAFQRVVKPGTPLIVGDASKLQQIFVNLLNNAIYAIVERHGNVGGKLEFTAESGGSGWALVKIRDNGTGIPKEVLSNIYTPFFTTKPPEKGTGLGLAVCYGLVESMGGTIEVFTREGEGTVFSVMLPSA